MVVEKGSDIATANQDVLEDGSSVQLGKQKSITGAFGEAVDVYGDIATAEELGYVHRGYMHPSYHACHPDQNC